MGHVIQIATDDFRRAVEEVHRMCIFHPDFIPMVHRGHVWAGAREFVREPQANLTAADFVLGMEALGVRFWIMKNEVGDERLLQPPGYHMLPAHWIPRAEAFRAVFPVERDPEAITFMRQRGDLAIGETPAPDPMLVLIEAYRKADAEHAQLSLTVETDDDADEAFRIEHIEPIRETIIQNPPAVTTIASAGACIRTALLEHMIPGQFERALLKAALAYLEQEASR